MSHIDTCPVCHTPAHASESDDYGRCAECAEADAPLDTLNDLHDAIEEYVASNTNGYADCLRSLEWATDGTREATLGGVIANEGAAAEAEMYLATRIVQSAESLDDLLDAWRDGNCAIFEAPGVPRADLPTYGGEAPDETTGVWSWDAARVLITYDGGEPCIVSREEWAEIACPVTDEQIQALGGEAGAAGDSETVADCEAALDGDASARERCEETIRYARERAEA